MEHTPVSAALDGVLQAARRARFPLAIPGVEEAESERKALANQLSDYLIPRSQRGDAPLLLVVGGSTGAGKSTLVNSLLGDDVSEAGVVRPTTHSPILVHHPDDADAFTSRRILPGLERVPAATSSPRARRPQLRLTAHEGVPRGIALVDAPDIDSVSDGNRESARQLLAAADLWLFVTTAARYADAVPWELLRESATRGTAVALVLDRIPAKASREVRHHLTDLLERTGLGSAPVFSVPELPLESGRLPASAIVPIRTWMASLGADESSRARIAQRTLAGALGAIPGSADSIADALERQGAAHERLSAAVDSSFGRARTGLEASLTDGQVLRGDVLARWQDFVGTGQFFRGLEPSVARVRDRITAAVTGKRDSAEPLGHALQESVAVLIREYSVQAVSGTVQAWQGSPEGRLVLDSNPSMARVPSDFSDDVRRAVEGWRRDVSTLVRDEGQSARAKARILSFGVDAVGAVLMLAVCAGIGRPTSSASSGTAVVAGKLLDTIFGDAVADLVQQAGERLIAVAEQSLGSCRRGFDLALSEHRPTDTDSQALRDAARNLKEAL